MSGTSNSAADQFQNPSETVLDRDTKENAVVETHGRQQTQKRPGSPQDRSQCPPSKKFAGPTVFEKDFDAVLAAEIDATLCHHFKCPETVNRKFWQGTALRGNLEKMLGGMESSIKFDFSPGPPQPLYIRYGLAGSTISNCAIKTDINRFKGAVSEILEKTKATKSTESVTVTIIMYTNNTSCHPDSAESQALVQALRNDVKQAATVQTNELQQVKKQLEKLKEKHREQAHELSREKERNGFHEKKTEEHEATIVALERKVAALEGDLPELHPVAQALKEMTRQRDEGSLELGHVRSALKEKTRLLNQTLHSVQAVQMGEQGQKVLELDEKLQKREMEIGELRELIATLKQEIRGLKDTIRQQDQSTTDQREKIAELKKEVKAWQDKVEKLIEEKYKILQGQLERNKKKELEDYGVPKPEEAE